MSIHFFDGNTGETYRYSNGKLEKIEQRDIPAPAPQGHELGGAGSVHSEQRIVGMRRPEGRAQVPLQVPASPLSAAEINARITAAVMAERLEIQREIGSRANLLSENGDDTSDYAEACLNACVAWIRSRPAPVAQAAETLTEQAVAREQAERAPLVKHGIRLQEAMNERILASVEDALKSTDYENLWVPLKADSALLEKAAQAMEDCVVGGGLNLSRHPNLKSYRVVQARAAAKAFGIEVGE